MKKGSTVAKEGCLPRATLRLIEREYGIYLDVPKNPTRSSNQQFGVYDEDEEYVGDIVASGRYFGEEELRQSIRARFRSS